eukprot:3449420-Pyramimonas_sp.AAC.3
MSTRVTQVRPKTQLIPEDTCARKDLYATEAQEHPSDVFGNALSHTARPPCTRFVLLKEGDNNSLHNPPSTA